MSPNDANILILPRFRSLSFRRERVICVNAGFAPSAVWPAGTLAFEQTLRGVPLPIATRITVDREDDGVTAILPIDWEVLGHRLPGASEVELASQRFLGARGGWLLLPLFFVAWLLGKVTGRLAVATVKLSADAVLAGHSFKAGTLISLDRRGVILGSYAPPVALP